MELDFRKKSRRDSIMRSKTFETQEAREIGWKEAGESIGFPIVWMKIIDVFQIQEKKCKDQERLKVWRRSMIQRGRCFSMVLATLCGPVAVDEERFVEAVRNSVE